MPPAVRRAWKRAAPSSLAPLLGALALLAATPAAAQTVRYGIVEDSVRAALESAWSDDPRQVERAYCVRRARISARPVGPGAVDTIIRVLAVRPAPVRDAGPNHADFDCPPGTPSLHVLPPATCVGDDPRWCEAGGSGAYSCQPSRDDYLTLVRLGDPFGVIQCDRRSFRFYYPSEFVVAPRPTRGARGAP
jgi:hypothetical protein